MIFTAMSDGRFELAGRWTRCALGKNGVRPASDKREGDGASPLGTWAIRRMLYRPDRGPVPVTVLPATPIAPNDGWCDAAGDRLYNQPVPLPYPASAEHLWREDGVYDLIVILGHNDDPPISGMGSAIFLHLARPGFTGTEGCIALTRPDLEALLALASPGDSLAIVQA